MKRGFKIAGVATAVTGGGGGIGRALCKALASNGAKSILALDRDLVAAQETARSIRAAWPACEVRALTCDASDGDALKAVLAQAPVPIDLFCANAGNLIGGTCSTASDKDWDASWSLNVMQLVHASGILVPQMEKRGGGAFLVTASAAGLLSQLGSAPYTVTKHAAVGLAEWLAISHAHQGIRVTCVCPQAVNTEMVAAAKRDPVHGKLMRAAALDGMLEPEVVAEEALAALEAGTFLCLPGGEASAARHVAKKAADRERWVNGMRKLQAGLAAAS